MNSQAELSPMQQYIEQEIDCFRQNRLLPTDLRERKYKADPQIDQHAENHLKVVGEIFAEIIEQHKEVDFSLKHIVSLPFYCMSATY